jgi:hypothetical protein
VGDRDAQKGAALEDLVDVGDDGAAATERDQVGQHRGLPRAGWGRDVHQRTSTRRRLIHLIGLSGTGWWPVCQSGGGVPQTTVNGSP